MSGEERFWRRTAAVGMTIWLIGITPAAVFDPDHDHHLLTKLWCLAPLELFLGGALGLILGAALWNFYGWALASTRPPAEDRIEQLEQELGIVSREVAE